MAETIFKKLFNVVTNKSQTYTLAGKQTFFPLLGNYIFGKVNYDKFTEAYGDNPLVYMIVKRVSFNSATIKRVAVNEQGEELENSILLDTLENPNPEQNQIEFLEEINEYLTTTGNAFIHHVKGIGAGDSFEVLITGNIEIVCDRSGQVFKYTYSKPNGTQVDYTPEEVLHIKSNNIVEKDENARKFGLSPLQAAWVTVKSSSEKFNAEASIFKNRGIIGFATNDTDIPMLEPERQRNQEAFTKAVGGSEKYNSIHVTNTRMRFVQTGMSPTDLKLLEGIVSSLRILCSVYGLSSVLFNDNENSTYNNVNEAVKASYNEVYIPLANKVDAALSKFLNGIFNTNETIQVDLTSIEVIKASTNEIAQAIGSLSPLLATKVLEQMSSEEIRDLINLGALSEGQVPIGAIGVEPTITTQA